MRTKKEKINPDQPVNDEPTQLYSNEEKPHLSGHDWRYQSQKQPLQVQQYTPDAMLYIAVKEGRSLEEISKLMDLYDRWHAKIAKSEFIKAKSQFRKDVPRILKNTNVNFPSRQPGGKNIDYNYADLGDIGEVIKEPLYKNGLDFDWIIDNSGPKIKVTCILSHVAGHEKTTTMEADADLSGSKNAIQSNGSTITYLERYTLKAVLGLTDADKDMDGRETKETPIETKVGGKIRPSDAEFNSITKSIISGTSQLEEVEKHFVFTEEQLKALKVAQDARNNRENPFNNKPVG